MDRSGSGEERYLKQLAWNALEAGAAHRLSIVGMSKPDIIDYLPVDQLAPSASSWERLREEWQQTRS